MLSLYFVYLDLGLDTRVFVCICLLATRGDSSASLVYSSTHTPSHLLAATLATIGAAAVSVSVSVSGSRRTNGQQRLGHDLVLGLAGGNDACTPPGAVGVGVCHWRHGGPN